MKARSCRLISRRAARTSTAVGSSCSDLPGWLAVPALVIVPSVAIHHQRRLANNLVQGLFPARLTAFVQKFLQKNQPPRTEDGCGCLARARAKLVGETAFGLLETEGPDLP